MTRHDLDVFSLLSGLALTGIALVALIGVSLGAAAWIWPTILIGVGIVVLASVVASTTRRDEPTPADDDHERAAAVAAARAEVEDADHG